MPRVLPTEKMRRTGYGDDKVAYLARYSIWKLQREGYIVVL